MWVHDLRDADASCGGKAVGLAQLIAAGLPVPPGFVVDDRAFRMVVGELASADPSAIGHALAGAVDQIARAELPAELVREVGRRAAKLGKSLAVRSSATIEDGTAGAAAGVFSSRIAVGVADVWDAIRAVWASALTPLAAAYAYRRGGTIAIGVIIQEFVEGERLTIYTRPPGAPTTDELIVQRGDRLVRHSRERSSAGEVIALAAEAAIGARDGADVELIETRGDTGDVSVQIVQARPIVHPVAKPSSPPPPSVLAPLDDGRTWTWDIAHNPDPLSPAQQGLVERVEGLGAWSSRVVAGFLYTTPREAPRRAFVDERELTIRAGELEAELERALGTEPAASVEDAIARYVAFYRIWAGELVPLIAAARTAVAAGASDLVGARPSSVEATLAAAARGELDEADVERLLGALAPAWDVAVATFGERPGLLHDAIERVRASPPAGTSQPAGPASPTTTAADLAERDDLLFARAQLLVRRALQTRATDLGLAADDIFWLPLDQPGPPEEAHRRASAARAAAARAATWQMPVVVGGRAAAHGPALQGVGSGPRVMGRVVRYASLARAVTVGRGDVIVTRAATPALAVFVAGCAALVSETGGLLDHGAALARELGVTCVVGCRDAWSQLGDGMLVIVDGEAGTVTRT